MCNFVPCLIFFFINSFMKRKLSSIFTRPTDNVQFCTLSYIFFINSFMKRDIFLHFHSAHGQCAILYLVLYLFSIVSTIPREKTFPLNFHSAHWTILHLVFACFDSFQNQAVWVWLYVESIWTLCESKWSMALSHVQAFNLDDPQQLEEKGIEAGTLFGNIGEIIEISDRFLEIMMLGFIDGSLLITWGHLDQQQVPWECSTTSFWREAC